MAQEAQGPSCKNCIPHHLSWPGPSGALWRWPPGLFSRDLAAQLHQPKVGLTITQIVYSYRHDKRGLSVLHTDRDIIHYTLCFQTSNQCEAIGPGLELAVQDRGAYHIAFENFFGVVPVATVSAVRLPVALPLSASGLAGLVGWLSARDKSPSHKRSVALCQP